MNLVAVGLSHKSAPVEVREKVAVAPWDLPGALKKMRAFADEGVLISTCNRVELYVHGKKDAVGLGAVKRFLAEMSGLSGKELDGALYEFRDVEAVRHLFEVSAGMDSMVPGETQILAQVKEAYTRAAAEGMTGAALNPLFQAAFREAKRIHTCTDIGKRKVSVGSVAVSLAEKVLGRLEGREVLVLGAGKMSELTLKHLASKGARTIIVANRTLQNAMELARKFEGRAVTFASLAESLQSADIVVASSAAPHYLVHAERLRPVMARRRGRPLFVIDIAVPRNVDPEVKRIRNVHLYDIDDLQKVVEKNLTERGREMRQCLRMVDEAARKYWRQAARAKSAPFIKEMTGRFLKIRQDEMEKARGKISGAPKGMKEVERLTERLVSRILHELVKGIKAGGGGAGEPPA